MITKRRFTYTITTTTDKVDHEREDKRMESRYKNRAEILSNLFELFAQAKGWTVFDRDIFGRGDVEEEEAVVDDDDEESVFDRDRRDWKNECQQLAEHLVGESKDEDWHFAERVTQGLPLLILKLANARDVESFPVESLVQPLDRFLASSELNDWLGKGKKRLITDERKRREGLHRELGEFAELVGKPPHAGS